MQAQQLAAEQEFPEINLDEGQESHNGKQADAGVPEAELAQLEKGDQPTEKKQSLLWLWALLGGIVVLAVIAFIIQLQPTKQSNSPANSFVPDPVETVDSTPTPAEVNPEIADLDNKLKEAVGVIEQLKLENRQKLTSISRDFELLKQQFSKEVTRIDRTVSGFRGETKAGREALDRLGKSEANIQEVKDALDGLGGQIKGLENQFNKMQNPPFIPSELEVRSATVGKGMYLVARTGKTITLTVGEVVKGRGQVESIESNGCITFSKLGLYEPIGASCIPK